MFAIVLVASMISAGALQASSASSSTPSLAGELPSAKSAHCRATVSTRFPINAAAAAEGAAADVDAVPAPAAALQWFVSIVAIWLFGLSRFAKARGKSSGTLEADDSASQKRLDSLSRDPSHKSASASPAYRDIVTGYDRLKGGKASTAEVDELRRQARALLSGRDEQALYELRQVRALLDWLDNARAYGRITITVQQLRVRKMGKWDIECGIDAGNRTAKAKMSVAGNMEVGNCALKVPWDPGSTIKLWMQLGDVGYETCCGHFGPIFMSSKEVLQDASGLSRGFHAEQFDKDFKVAFSIQRNFGDMPCVQADGGRRLSIPFANESRLSPAAVKSGHRGY
jgi:hypothetical protein